jgi:hypothetical protein
MGSRATGSKRSADLRSPPAPLRFFDDESFPEITEALPQSLFTSFGCRWCIHPGLGSLSLTE